MQFLGIGYENKAIYGGGTRQRMDRILPNSVVLAFKYQNESLNNQSTFMQGFSNCIFIEESYDPVTRVRRGRVYEYDPSPQPKEIFVNEPRGQFSEHREKIVKYQAESFSELSKKARKYGKFIV